jgi:hypothetical protein
MTAIAGLLGGQVDTLNQSHMLASLTRFGTLQHKEQCLCEAQLVDIQILSVQNPPENPHNISIPIYYQSG